MANNFTDKKINPRNTVDRRRYYSPTPSQTICPFLKLDENGAPLVITDITGGDPHLRCGCLEEGANCSYNIPGDNLIVKDTNETMPICHRYLAWYNDTEKYNGPVDTHERRLMLKGNMLNWF